MNTDLLPKAVELVELAKKDRFVQQLIMKTLTERGLKSVGQLGHENPEAFEELYGVCKTMVEELPWI